MCEATYESFNSDKYLPQRRAAAPEVEKVEQESA